MSDSDSDKPGRIQQMPDDQKILVKLIGVRLMPTRPEDLFIICSCGRQPGFIATQLLKDLSKLDSCRMLTWSRAGKMKLKCLGAISNTGPEGRVAHGPWMELFRTVGRTMQVVSPRGPLTSDSKLESMVL